MAVIMAPVDSFNGNVGGVQFANGQAETDDPAVIAYCESAGYTVKQPKPVKAKAKPEPATEPTE